MVDFDEALNILENKARRDILRRLAKEPHYPLQLSELLDISQQAVVKHLRVLEENGFVESEKIKKYFLFNFFKNFFFLNEDPKTPLEPVKSIFFFTLQLNK